MKPHQIEAWVLEIISRVETGQPIEDSRVELKTIWPPPEKAARQIAGHANASQGAKILWLIGIDEKSGVFGAPYEELAEWYPQVKSQFDGLAPNLSHFNIPFKDKTVAALLFDTDRAPFLVKNPVYGKHNGGPVGLEVPWRENNSTRTATRSDLLRILTPLLSLPHFEILHGTLTASKVEKNNEVEFFWSLRFDLYVETSTEEPVVIPFHRCKIGFEIPEKLQWTKFQDFSLLPPQQSSGVFGAKERLLSLTINATQDEIIIKGPGKIILNASLNSGFIDDIFHRGVLIKTSIFPVNARNPLSLELPLSPSPNCKFDSKQYTWNFQGQKDDERF